MADHNVGYAKGLARASFEQIGSDTPFAPGVGTELVERICRLDH